MKLTFVLFLLLVFLIYTTFATPTTQKLRIVTDLQVIGGINGVPIDYNTYNETKTSFAYPSSPGCPKSIDGYPWLHFKNNCYLAGYRGPCPEGEMLLIQPNSMNGTCGCDCLSISINVKYKANETSEERYKTCVSEISHVAPAGQVYDKKEQKCYAYYEQGPCAKGSVIVHRLTENTEVTCLPFCSSLPENVQEIASNSGECENGVKLLYTLFLYLNIIHG